MSSHNVTLDCNMILMHIVNKPVKETIDIVQSDLIHIHQFLILVILPQ